MKLKLVECIPNFSEGRNMEIVEQIIHVVESVPGVNVLDHHSDEDHNRTVVTLVGSPESVSEAVYQSIRKAAELIDMDLHEGAHPRMGAADVVPFVPIKNMSMDECVELARVLGKRVGEELGIPVYLYESAATSPDRINLEKIRKGEYEGLKKEIETDPKRKPDFGPSKLGKAGAVVIGARAPLIAFNVYLSTDDVGTARKIARTIRHSSGGLRYVKAMGVLVDGLAQVSMNLTNFHKTAIPLVVEAIRREAKRYGTTIHHSELVGLTPREALIDTAVWYTQLDQFTQDQVLENKLEGSADDAQFNFLHEMASETPTPGGGSAAAFTAAESAALVSMVCRLTLGKKKYKQYSDEITRILERSEVLRRELIDLVGRDAEVFKGVMQAYRLPKSAEKESAKRKEAIRNALLLAARVPLETSRKSSELLALSIDAVEICNINAITDLAAAAQLARAAASTAGANVRINLLDLDGNSEAEEIRKNLEELEQSIKKFDQGFRGRFSNRSGIDLL